MAYEKHEWVNGETITAEKMNNIEEGIAEASQSGGGGNMAIVYVPNSTIGWQVEGIDFATAYASLVDGKPVCIFYYDNTYISGQFVSFTDFLPFYAVEVDPQQYPNRITLYYSTSNGLYWTENGFEYWD